MKINAFTSFRNVFTTIAIFAISFNAFADNAQVVTDDEVVTVGGPLKLMRESKPIPDSRYWDVSYKLMFNDKVIQGPTTSNYDILSSYPSQFDAKYVVFFLPTGGSGCPGFFKIIEIGTEGIKNITEEFGNCSDLATTEYKNDTVTVSIGADRWSYSNGKLRQQTKP